MNIQSLQKFMFSEERMDELQKSKSKKTIEPVCVLPIIQMPRSKLPPTIFDFQEEIKVEKTIEEIKVVEEIKVEKTIEKIKVEEIVPNIQTFKKPNDIVEPKSDLFFPKEKDKLFWCFYIMKHGMEEYNSLEYKNIIVEKKIKIEYIELLRTKKQLLKEHKITPLSHIENFLLNEIKIDLKTFLALCVCENLPMIYIHKNTYYELLLDDISYNDDKIPMYTITQFDEPLKYGYKIQNKEITQTLYKIDNLNKPLKAMSAYKVDELLVICHKLGISMSDKKETKQDLYEKIVQRL